MDWELLRKKENKILFQVTLYESILSELRRISEIERLPITHIVRAAINAGIREYHEIEAEEKVLNAPE